MLIPRTVIQTSLQPQYPYVVDMIKRRLSNWQYLYFSDADIIEFFKQNFIDEFSEIEDRFNQIKNGAHKADLFRYYYLYLKGGMYLDSDAMIYLPIEDIVEDASFVSIHSYHTYDNFIFNGFICVSPRHEILYKALKSMYDMPVEQLNKDYFAVCRKLFQIVDEYKRNDVKIYRECKPKFYEIAATTNKNGKALLRHYRFCKVIPDDGVSFAASIRNLKIYLCYSCKIIINACVRIYQRLIGRLIRLK